MSLHALKTKVIPLRFKQTVYFCILLLTAVGLSTYGLFANSSFLRPAEVSAQVSPELYNSAFAPVGEAGGEIIPASCSLGYPWHIGEPGPNPCNPTLTMYSLGSTPALTPTGGHYSLNITGGGSVSFGYTSNYAEYCDVVTAMSEPGIGFYMYYVENPSRDYYNLGPIANKNGWVHYQVVCRQGGDRATAAFVEKVLYINTSLQPTVKVSFEPQLKINSFTGIDTGPSFGELSWSVTGATSCSATGASGGWSGSSLSPTGGTRAVTYSNMSFPRTYSYTLTCTNGTDTVMQATSISFEGTGMGGCFIPGTKVTMADGTQRDIETVQVGEYLMTSGGAGRVEKLWHIPYQGKLFAFNGSDNYFVTDSHPFMTTEGWKSFSPAKTKLENPDLVVTPLSVGDTLVREDGSHYTLTQVDSIETDQIVYNFKIEGQTNDFYADGFWVHNAPIKQIQ